MLCSRDRCSRCSPCRVHPVRPPGFTVTSVGGLAGGVAENVGVDEPKGEIAIILVGKRDCAEAGVVAQLVMPGSV